VKYVKNGDIVSCTYNGKVVTGKLVGSTKEQAAVYISDDTGGYQIAVPSNSLFCSFSNLPISISGEGFLEYTLPREYHLTKSLSEFYSKEEEISKPKRYNKVGALECWDVITDQKMDFLEGNVMKYLWRHKDKNGKADLKKAKEYLEKMIADYEKLYNNEK